MKQILFVLFTAILITSCNDSGGSWSNADTQKFMNTCLQNARNAGADEQTANAHCNCTLGKIQKNFKSYAEADQKMTQEQVTAIEQQCLQEAQNKGNNGNKKGGILGGGGGGGLGNGGGWSDADKQKFMNTCVQNAINAGGDEQTARAHCECTLGKLEKKANSYAEADQKMTQAEVRALEQECNQEQNGNDNQ